jgi:hypothetical protein
MNNYKIYIGVDVSKEYFTTTVLTTRKKPSRLFLKLRSLKKGLRIT